MQTQLSGSLLEAENLLRAAGWAKCPASRQRFSSMPGRSCWILHQDDPLSPDAFVTDYGYVLEVPHGTLCAPSVLRFPRAPGERSYQPAFERLGLFLEAGDFWPTMAGD